MPGDGRGIEGGMKNGCEWGGVSAPSSFGNFVLDSGMKNGYEGDGAGTPSSSRGVDGRKKKGYDGNSAWPYRVTKILGLTA